MKIDMQASMIILLLLSFFASCRQPQKVSIISQEKFLQENQAKEFESWKYWDVSKRYSYYMATIGCDTSKATQRLIFWKKDSTHVRFVLNYSSQKQDSELMSEIYNIEKLNQSIVDSLLFDFRLNDLKNHIDFIYKYDLESVLFKDYPDRVYFKANKLDVLYFLPL